MLLHLKEILSPDEVRQARKILANAPWGDGKVTSGQQSALVKNNSQLPEHCAESKQLQKLVLDGLTRDPLFFSAALPKRISPPLFNHYGGAQQFWRSRRYLRALPAQWRARPYRHVVHLVPERALGI